jgi:hypothetical protein
MIKANLERYSRPVKSPSFDPIFGGNRHGEKTPVLLE